MHQSLLFESLSHLKIGLIVSRKSDDIPKILVIRYSLDKYVMVRGIKIFVFVDSLRTIEAVIEVLFIE